MLQAVISEFWQVTARREPINPSNHVAQEDSQARWRRFCERLPAKLGVKDEIAGISQ